MRAGQPPGQVVGLAAGADEHADVQRTRQRGEQALGQLEDRLVEISGVRVDSRGLRANGFDDVRVRVADVGHVVVGIQVASAGGVVDPGALAAHEMQGTIVELLIDGAQDLRASIRQRLELSLAGLSPRRARPILCRMERLEEVPRVESREVIDHLPRVLVVGGDVGRILRVHLHAPCRDENRRGQPSEPELEQDGQLLSVEGDHRLVAGDDPSGVSDGIRGARDHGSEQDGEVVHERGVDHVAEVDEPRDGFTCAALARIDQDVPTVRIGVDHLRAQPRQDRECTRPRSDRAPGPRGCEAPGSPPCRAAAAGFRPA